ncbi:MAG TPA: alpha/beta fold hydrolase [Acidimicrobiales bacterium]|nr:alpha/beta fold hydrolase [Acidimicrobiales bacterium]
MSDCSLTYEEGEFMHLDVNGTRLHVSEEGSGHAVLFLHGMGCDGTDWQPQVDAFAARYRCITIDHRGHGRSDREVGEGYSIAGFAADALGVLDHLGVDRAHVVGLSMGGMIAQQLAVTEPDRVCTLSLLDTFARPGAMGEGMGAMADQVEAGGLDALAAGFQAMVFAAATIGSKPDLLERFDAQFRGNTPACLAWDMRAIAALDVYDELGSITAPTVVLCGAEDNLTPMAQAEELAAAIPGATLEIVPDAGHFSNIENPDFVNQVLAKQLEQPCQHGGAA